MIVLKRLRRSTILTPSLIPFPHFRFYLNRKISRIPIFDRDLPINFRLPFSLSEPHHLHEYVIKIFA